MAGFLWRAAHLLGLVVALALPAAADEPERGPDGKIVFRLPIDDSLLPLDLRPEQKPTPATEAFHQSGKNPYVGQPQAVEEGLAIWKKWCRACHLDDGTGRIGPSLVDAQTHYRRVKDDVGLFEIVYGGGAGAMQAFGKRMDQDDILKVIAYVRELQAKSPK